jgi:hypothetical protein
VVSETWTLGVTGASLSQPLRGNAQHTLAITFVSVPPNIECSAGSERVFFAVLGQYGSGSEHFIVCSTDTYQGKTSNVQIGAWNGNMVQQPSVDLYGAITDNKTHSIVTMLDSSGTYSLFLDGELVGSETEVQFDFQSSQLVLGNAINTTAAKMTLSSLIYKVQLWDRALTDQQVRAIYKGGLPGKLFSSL